MKKIKKTQARTSFRNHQIDYPEMVDMDTLSYASDDDLDRRMGFLAAERERAVHSDIDPRPWEEEICYVQRELRIRSGRRFAHDRYLRIHPDANPSFSSFEDDVAVN